MKKNLILFSFCLFTTYLSAQDTTNKHIGTIKIQKKGQIAKVQFDNVYYRLIGIDQYGNVLDTAVVEFQMAVNVNGIFLFRKSHRPSIN